VLLNYNERLSLRTVRAVGIGAPFEHNLFETAAVGVGVDLGNESTHGPASVENVTVEGFETGVIAPRNGDWAMADMRLANVTDLLVHEARQAPRTLALSGLTFADLDGTAVAGREEERRHVVLDAHLGPDDQQPHFFLMPDRITLDGEGVYFDQQAGDVIPATGVDDDVEDDVALDEEGGEDDDPDDDEGSGEDAGDEGDDEVDDDDFEEDDEFEDDEGLDPRYLGLTNRRLWERFGLSFGGALLPEDGKRRPIVVGGLIGPAAPPPTTFPALADVTNVE
jgi:hypothetical protein